MKIWQIPVSFEWDEGNLDKNFRKHKFTNQEAEEVFENKPNFTFVDEKHSSDEKRYMIWGKTDKSRSLTIFFTLRNKKD